MKKLYCFDFDGTLTKEDTMFSFLKFYDKKKYWVNFAKHTPLFILLKLKLVNAEKVKKNFIASILKGETEEKINQKANLFFEKNYPKIIRPTAISFIQNIDRENISCYLVTASLDIWVHPLQKILVSS